jgi:hypothetical protein
MEEFYQGNVPKVNEYPAYTSMACNDINYFARFVHEKEWDKKMRVDQVKDEGRFKEDSYIQTSTPEVQRIAGVAGKEDNKGSKK